jgi:hypothetical protein
VLADAAIYRLRMDDTADATADDTENASVADGAPGSPVSFADFRLWCRAGVEAAVASGAIPKLLFANSRDLDRPLIAEWEETFAPPAILEFLTKFIPLIAEHTGASQVAVAVPYGGNGARALLVSVDETDCAVEEARVFLDAEELVLEPWHTVSHELPVVAWQLLLAANAGYDDFAKWHCSQCDSVCLGEGALQPAPCDYCGSYDVERVSLVRALAPPRLPYPDESALDFLDQLRPFFAATG